MVLRLCVNACIDAAPCDENGDPQPGFTLMCQDCPNREYCIYDDGVGVVGTEAGAKKN